MIRYLAFFTLTPDINISCVIDESPVVFKRNDSLAHNPEYLPHFEISYREEPIGYITRGHALIVDKFRGQGFFDRALEYLEGYERWRLADHRNWPQYQQAILEGIGIGKKSFESFVLKESNPCHLDFWRLPGVAARYMKAGYELAPSCVLELKARNLLTDSNKESVMNCLKTNHGFLKAQGFLCVLKKEFATNPMEQD